MLPPSDVDPDLQRLKWLLVNATLDLKLELLGRAIKAAFNPDQPRVSAGSPEGGRWTGGDDPQVLSDATPDNEWKPGAQYASSSRSTRPDGHHFMPRSLYRDLPLSPETRKVFDDAKTGRLYDDRHQFDEPHRQYNTAVREHFERFMDTNKIQPEQMTPDQARSLVREIKESRDPRIRIYNMRIYMREIMHQLRRVRRGNE